MKTELVTAPAAYPITLTEAKKQCEIGSETTHDTYVKSLIIAATAKAEQFLHRRLVTQTWKNYLDVWPLGTSFKLPFGRLQSVSSIKYKDEDGNESTFSADDYIVDIQSEPGIIELGYQKSWPTGTLYPNNPIKIEFVCGYYIGSTWVVGTGYSENNIVMPITENGLVYQAGNVGTSHSTEPTWPLTIGDTVVDNDITWTCLGMAVPEPIRHAIKLTISDLFENRETEYFGISSHKLRTFENLLLPYKLFGGVF
jgi:uncharacterized phiE125 gp8 family phage protein